MTGAGNGGNRFANRHTRSRRRPRSRATDLSCPLFRRTTFSMLRARSSAASLTSSASRRISKPPSGRPAIITGAALTAGNWYHLVVAQTGGTATLYVNGSSVGTGAQGQALGAYSDFHALGDSFNQSLNGVGDESRVSNVARSADWILTEYNNQVNPSSFVAVSIAALVTGAPGLTLTGAGA